LTASKARALTFGAVSIVNAIASGRGATASIKLTTEASVELDDSPGGWEALLNGERSDSPLAIETVKRAIKGAGRDPLKYSGRVETSSTLPVGVGLKTSSASSTAIAIATFAALGQRALDTKKVLECSIDASLASGASITGAMDDAAGCLLGGINMTDNLARKVVGSRLFDRKLLVVIRVPREASRRAAVDPNFVRRFGALADVSFELALKGDYWRAMLLNGMTYSSILKYDPFPALRAVELGALGAGLSGTGPAVAAVFEATKREEARALVKGWSEDGSWVIETETNNEHGRLVSVG
jgi:shikimate kinase